MHDTRYFYVSGHVQGVSFRTSARNMARSLGLRGWVRNRRDGSVEGVASGDSDALHRFHGWLGQGPAPATVEHVVFEPTTVTAPETDFVIR